MNLRIKRNIFLLTLLSVVFSTPIGISQNLTDERAKYVDNSPTWAVKTNLVGWAAAASINAGAEVKMAPKWTLNMDVSYNPFQYRSNKKLKHILVAPEARWWLCAPYSGHFIGGNLMYSHYNAGGMNVPFVDDLKNYRYQGNLYGVGFVYGYHLVLSPRWSIEFEAGLGYGFTKYKKYDCPVCGAWRADEKKHMLMPTKFAISVVYVIK